LINELLIFLGAGIGGVFRYWVSNATYFFLDRQFPYGTLIVNVSGSFLMGFLFILIHQKFGNLNIQLRALLLIGLLGGYTTFSSFSIETFTLLENGQYLSAMINILSSIILCLLAAWIGVIAGRSV
jgi:CrcB protein